MLLQSLIYLAYFFGGVVATISSIVFLTRKQRKAALNKERSICVHCGKMILTKNRDHWRECEKHPARKIMDEICAMVNEYDYNKIPITLAYMLVGKNQTIVDLTKQNTTALSLLEAADIGQQSLLEKVKALQDGNDSYEWFLQELGTMLNTAPGNAVATGYAIEALQAKAEALQKITGAMLTVKSANQPEWMEYIAGEINIVCELSAMAERVRFVNDRLCPFVPDDASQSADVLSLSENDFCGPECGAYQPEA